MVRYSQMLRRTRKNADARVTFHIQMSQQTLSNKTHFRKKFEHIYEINTVKLNVNNSTFSLASKEYRVPEMFMGFAIYLILYPSD